MSKTFFRLILLLGCFSLFLAMDVAAQEEDQSMEQAVVWPGLEGDRFNAAMSLFGEHCADCHEEDGNSEVEKLNLADGVWRNEGTLVEIERTIREGIPDTKMKAHKDVFSPAEIGDLAKYVKYLEHKMFVKQAEEGFQKAATPDEEKAERPPPLDLSKLPALVSLQVIPHAPTLWGAEASQKFIVLGTFADGIERDVTPLAEISISEPTFATLEPGARVVAKADGDLVLRAHLVNQVADTRISIKDSQQERPFSFEREIGSVLTKRGCNATDCHGGVKGRGGFKLSINVLRPQTDYDWIVRGGGYKVLTDEIAGEQIPRINKDDPEKSLILLKPTFQVDHEGGKRFGKDSQESATIASWVRAGAPFGEEGHEELKITGLEVLPKETALDPGGHHQLLVTAQLANGRREDVTDQVRFTTGNKDVVKVSADGIVRAVGKGETHLVIRAAGYETATRVGVIKQTVADYPDVPKINLIDEHIFAKLQKFRILPSDLSSDSEFLRRVCLDLTGTLPPHNRVGEFLEDSNPDKRDKLIDTLLTSPEYNDYWTFVFSDLFRVGPSSYFAEVYKHWSWVRDCVTRNRPWDEIARERIAPQGYRSGPSRFLVGFNKSKTLGPLMAENFQVFMGRRLDCSQCHDHPFEIWSQNQYWGLAAFNARLTTTDWTNDRLVYDDPEGQSLDWGEGGQEDLEFIKAVNPRTKQEMPPTYLDGTVLSEDQRGEPRAALAEWMTSHPYFAQAMVNRMWGYFFGKGLVDPVDDFKSSNPPTHAKLLEALAKDFQDHGYDLKHLIRRIVRSRTYQLSGIPNESNKDDTVNYSHSLPRPLPAEVLLDMIGYVTGVPASFDRTNSSGGGGITPRGLRAIQLKYPAKWPSQFVDAYGRVMRNAHGERSGDPSLAQSLHMLVGNTYTDQISKEGGRLSELAEEGFTNREIVEELYLAALSRSPHQEELDGLEEMLAGLSPMVTDPFFAKGGKRREGLEDLVWALVSSREFAYNH